MRRAKQKPIPKPYKSQLEVEVANYLGDNAEYESEYIEFIQPAKPRRYSPDFKTKAGIYLESKGKWDAADRQKHVWLRQQHPDKRIIIVFQNPDVRLSKRSKTSYAEWADKNGIEWIDWRKRTIPKELIIENQEDRGNTRRANRTRSKSK